MQCRATLALAAVYASCILHPGAALALGSTAAAHCLTKTAPAHVHKTAAKAEITHVHSDGLVNSHARPGDRRHADAAALHHDGA